MKNYIWSRGSQINVADILSECFRRFSGHTQVNALKYPSRDTLISLGRWAARQGELSQEEMDSKIRKLGIVSP